MGQSNDMFAGLFLWLAGVVLLLLFLNKDGEYSRQKMKEQENEKLLLSQKIQELEKEIAEKTEQLNLAQQKIAALEQKLLENEEQITQLREQSEKTKREYQARIKHLEAKLEGAKRQILSIEEEFKYAAEEV